MARSVILIADANETLRQVLAVTLADTEVEIIQAADGEEAARQGESRRPALAILSIGLPILTGLEVCRRLKAIESPAAYVLVLGAADKPMERAAALQAGADDFVELPYSPIALADKVQRALDRPSG